MFITRQVCPAELRMPLGEGSWQLDRATLARPDLPWQLCWDSASCGGPETPTGGPLHASTSLGSTKTQSSLQFSQQTGGHRL